MEFTDSLPKFNSMHNSYICFLHDEQALKAKLTQMQILYRKLLVTSSVMQTLFMERKQHQSNVIKHLNSGSSLLIQFGQPLPPVLLTNRVLGGNCGAKTKEKQGGHMLGGSRREGKAGVRR